MSIIKYAAAKINVLLDLGQCFDDGYHGIYTIMQSVSLYDVITVDKRDKNITVDCNIGIPLDETNAAHKAAKLFFNYTKIKSGVYIHMEKNIPTQAGLGGGSADAAAVLHAMNDLFNTRLSIDELCDIGVNIGADVPFCITGGTRLCQNIGEVQSRLPDFPDCYFVIVKPISSVSTKLAYASYDERDDIRHPDREWLLNKYCRGNFAEFCKNTGNVFEQVVLVPERAEIKAIMRKNGSVAEMMSGSGSSIFGIFLTKASAQKAANDLKRNNGKVYLTEPVKKGIFDKVNIEDIYS
jgi:4-diphosphocytidyl-2-C-methyl-D-erythritol kinase